MESFVSYWLFPPRWSKRWSHWWWCHEMRGPLWMQEPPMWGYEPGITFIVAQKRHFCSKEEDVVGNNASVPPGTTVDRDITHLPNHDLYIIRWKLVVIPKYVAVRDATCPPECQHGKRVQMLSYQLYYVIFCCNRSVSYSAPTSCCLPCSNTSPSLGRQNQLQCKHD